MIDAITTRPPRDVAQRLVRRIAVYGNLEAVQIFQFRHSEVCAIPPGYAAIVKVELAREEKIEFEVNCD